MKDENESGMMVVEATLCFTIFIIVCLAIVELINIFTVHNRIQAAIDSTARQIASYSYIYEVIGARSISKQAAEDGETYTDKINEAEDSVYDTAEAIVDTVNSIQQLKLSADQLLSADRVDTDTDALVSIDIDGLQSDLKSFTSAAKSTVSNAQTAGKDLKEAGTKLKGLLSDPKGTLAGIIYIAAEGAEYWAKVLVGSLLAEVMTEQYLGYDMSGVGTQDADSYLLSYQIIDGYDGLDFSHSSFLCDSDERMIDVVVEYDIDLGFLGLILPKDSRKQHVVQRACVAGWCGGDDVEVEDYFEKAD